MLTLVVFALAVAQGSQQPKTHGLPVPKIRELPLPKIKELPLPRLKDSPLPRVKDLPLPKTEELPLPRVKELPLPKVKELQVPKVKELPLPKLRSQGSQSLTLGYNPSPLRGLGLALEGRRNIAQGEALRTLGIQARTLGTKAPITALTIAPDGKSIVSGSQSGIQILTYPDLKPDRTLNTELPNIHDLAFSPDGKTLAVAGGIPGKRGMVELFTWPEGKLLHRLKPHSDLIYSVAWKADSSTIATASADRTISLIDAKSGQTTRSFEGHSRGVLAVAFIPGDAELITAGIDESVRLWNIKTGETVRTLANHTKPVHALAVRPDNRDAPPMVVSISDDRTVRLWQPTLGRMVRFARLEVIPLAVCLTADSKAIVVACKDGHVRSIDPDTMEVTSDRAAIDGIAYSLLITRDDNIIVAGQNGQTKLLKSAKSK